ncbi:MAG: hypothetical protein KJ970_09755 [Candidatus Eisenbacteria bacterium]|uniref:Tetratricopeptide repeat protein n=1 Tax=Eiseniibacteriota bacterium TaxID=2212470 RepID=A0A948RX69_UNCEI|nr:hypothetical protein [Candidatus Eisenbacteria bacterium]MBU1949403.1 hypothetical protein [Candidatus Eisenbacteria bacterium]MBU2691202.1 hypothetical protein [Candidatus Eisenbacteria bacterium]
MKSLIRRFLPPLALLGVLALLVYQPGAPVHLRNWGFHFLTYFPLPVSLLFWLSAALLTLWSPAGRLFGRGIEAWGHLLADGGASAFRKRIADTGIPVLLVGLFWILRSRYAFLGDNWLRYDQALRGIHLPYEWGTMVLFHQALKWIPAVLKIEPRVVLSILNTLAGLPYLAASVLLARVLGKSAYQRGFIQLGLLAIGALQFYCGYVEAYSWALAFIALSLAAVFRAFEGKSRLLPFIFFAIAVLLHAIAALFALPLLLLLVHFFSEPFSDFLERPRSGPVRLTALMILLGALASPLLMPELFHQYTSPRPGDLTLLQPALWWERLNGLILAAPLGALIGLPLLLRFLVKGDYQNRERLILAAAAFPPVVVLVLMKMVLGSADWDIIAFTGLPLILFASVWIRDRKYKETGQPLITLLLFLSLCNTWSFITINHGNASIQRIKDIIADDPAPYYQNHPPPMHAAFLFYSNNLQEQRREVLQQGVLEYPDDPRMVYNLAVACYESGELDKARYWTLEALARNSGYLPPVYLLYLIAGQRGDDHEKRLAGETILRAHDEDPAMTSRYIQPDQLEEVRNTVERLRSRGRTDEERNSQDHVED